MRHTLFARIGIIGSGAVGRAVATRALSARIPVVLSNSRGPDTLKELVCELGEGASAGTLVQAANADLVLIAIPFVKVPELAGEVPDWSGRVVVDATNQFAQYEPTYSGFVDLGDETGSEWVARHLPGATVIKAFNAMFAEYIMARPPAPRWAPSLVLRRRRRRGQRRVRRIRRGAWLRPRASGRPA